MNISEITMMDTELALRQARILRSLRANVHVSNASAPSRERSLAVTKMDEAIHWLEADLAKRPGHPGYQPPASS